jgi:hypothetical protein
VKITDALTAEHTVFLRTFEQLEGRLPTLTEVAEVNLLAELVEAQLQIHAAQEANLAYLALDHVLAERQELDRMHQDHHEIDIRLKQAQSARSCAEACQLLRSAIAASRDHFRQEEEVLFPLLEQWLSPETLAELGRSLLRRRPAVPAKP